MHHLGLMDVLLIEQSREQAGAWPAPIFAKPKNGQEALHKGV